MTLRKKRITLPGRIRNTLEGLNDSVGDLKTYLSKMEKQSDRIVLTDEYIKNRNCVEIHLLEIQNNLSKLNIDIRRGNKILASLHKECTCNEIK